MTAERKTAYIAGIVDIWGPILAMDLMTLEEFKQKIVDAVEYLEEQIMESV